MTDKLAPIMIAIALALSGCDREPPPPQDYYFEMGDRAEFTATGEIIRIVGVWRPFGKSDKYRNGQYTIHFADGSEINAHWYQLKGPDND